MKGDGTVAQQAFDLFEGSVLCYEASLDSLQVTISLDEIQRKDRNPFKPVIWSITSKSTTT